MNKYLADVLGVAPFHPDLCSDEGGISACLEFLVAPGLIPTDESRRSPVRHLYPQIFETPSGYRPLGRFAGSRPPLLGSFAQEHARWAVGILLVIFRL